MNIMKNTKKPSKRYLGETTRSVRYFWKSFWSINPVDTVVSLSMCVSSSILMMQRYARYQRELGQVMIAEKRSFIS